MQKEMNRKWDLICFGIFRQWKLKYEQIENKNDLVLFQKFGRLWFECIPHLNIKLLSKSNWYNKSDQGKGYINPIKSNPKMEFFAAFVKVITENPRKHNSVTTDLLNSLTKTAMLNEADRWTKKTGGGRKIYNNFTSLTL